MDVGVTSAVLASAVCLTVAIAILIRRPRRPLYTYFAAFSGSLFVWHTSSLASRFGHVSISPWQSGAALLIPPAAVAFFRELLQVGDRKLTSQHAAFGVSGILLLCNASPWGHSVWVRGAIGLYLFVTLAFLHQTLFLHMRRARSEADRARLSYLLYGGLAALGLIWGALIPGIPMLAAMGHVAATLYIYFLYQSIVARRLIDLVELLGKGAVLAALTLLLATVYALLVLWVGSHQQGLWLFNTLVASFVILILYDQVRPWIEETTAKLFFRERYELRQVLQQLLRVLRTTIGTQAMGTHVLDALHASSRTRQVAVYLATEVDFSFQLLAFRGSKPPPLLGLRHQPTLLQELRRERRPILQEHLYHRYQELPTLLTRSDPTLQRELDRTAESIEAMKSLNASLVLPMLIEDRIVGVLTLGAEHLNESYSTDELASLLSLAEACAVIIENSHEYEQHRQRDRLVAVGEMAAGMAHEIRNPLGAIKGAAQCLDPSMLLPHAQADAQARDAQEFIDVIIEEVDRLNGVVSQFLAYARPWHGNPMVINVNKVVLATLRLLGKDAVPDNISIQTKLAPHVPWVCVDPEQLKQVLINLMLNAVQAMPRGGQITLTTAVHTSPALFSAHGSAHGSDHGSDHGDLPSAPASTDLGSAHVWIQLQDTGDGIRSEDMPRIFLPFFTTKPHGTGLGLSICQRIIENAGGRIRVGSQQGEGTTFTLRFPAASAGQQPPLLPTPFSADAPAFPTTPAPLASPDLHDPRPVKASVSLSPSPSPSPSPQIPCKPREPKSLTQADAAPPAARANVLQTVGLARSLCEGLGRLSILS